MSLCSPAAPEVSWPCGKSSQLSPTQEQLSLRWPQKVAVEPLSKLISSRDKMCSTLPSSMIYLILASFFTQVIFIQSSVVTDKHNAVDRAHSRV